MDFEQRIQAIMREIGADAVTVDCRIGPDGALRYEVDARSTYLEWGRCDAATLEEALAGLRATEQRR